MDACSRQTQAGPGKRGRPNPSRRGPCWHGPLSGAVRVRAGSGGTDRRHGTHAIFDPRGPADARRQRPREAKGRAWHDELTGQKRIRKFYGKIREVLEMPNLIEVQKSSYDLFLNSGEATPTDGDGIRVFSSRSFRSRISTNRVLEFVKYELEPPKYDVEECQQRDMTYAAPLKVTLRLIVFDVDEDTGAKSVKDIKEQDVFMGDMPLMTPNGTFIVNGTERVIVSQMHRSPGVFFDHDKGKTHSSGKLLFACRIIPYRGSWLDFEFDAKDLVFARIDRRRKLPVTTLLYALGLDQEAIMGAYYDTVDFVHRPGEGWATRSSPSVCAAPAGLRPCRRRDRRGDRRGGQEGDAARGQEADRRGQRHRICWCRSTRSSAVFAARHHRRGDRRDLCRGRRRADLGTDKDGRRHRRHAEELIDAGVTEIPVLDIDNITVGAYIRNTMAPTRTMTARRR
jgi:DNA-directed RNA polymerase subunit beta